MNFEGSAPIADLEGFGNTCPERIERLVLVWPAILLLKDVAVKGLPYNCARPTDYLLSWRHALVPRSLPRTIQRAELIRHGCSWRHGDLGNSGLLYSTAIVPITSSWRRASSPILHGGLRLFYQSRDVHGVVQELVVIQQNFSFNFNFILFVGVLPRALFHLRSGFCFLDAMQQGRIR